MKELTISGEPALEADYEHRMFRQAISSSVDEMSDFTCRFPIVFRRCRHSDLRALEWFGMFYAQRELIEKAFAEQKGGRNIMLLAETNRFPVGQVWIDVSKKRPQRVGILWALRVLPPFQGQGLGARLIENGEAMLYSRGFSIAELAVEKTNPRARKLYLRLGYEVVGSQREHWDYLTPEGRRIQAHADEWVLQKPLRARPME